MGDELALSNKKNAAEEQHSESTINWSKKGGADSKQLTGAEGSMKVEIMEKNSFAQQQIDVEGDLKSDSLETSGGSKERLKTKEPNHPKNAIDSHDGKEQNSISTVTSVSRSEYIFESSHGSVGYEESHVKIIHKAEESSSLLAETEGDMECNKSDMDRRNDIVIVDESRSSSETRDESPNEPEDKSNSMVGKAPTKEAQQAELKEKVSDGNEDENHTDTFQEVSARKSTRSYKPNAKKNVEGTLADSKVEKTQGSDNSVCERRKSLRTRKSDVSHVTMAPKNESVVEKRRISLRTPKKSASLSSPVSRVTRIENKMETRESESEFADDKTALSGKSSKKNASSTSSVSKSARNFAKKEAVKRKRASDSDKDPFSFDKNSDNHPEPLRNIQMERQSFGGYKFTKSPEQTIASRYQKTEQTAHKRRSNLTNLLPQQEISTHKSLSELSLSASQRSGMKTTSKRKTKSIGVEVIEPSGSSTTVSRFSNKSDVEKRSKDISQLEDKQIQSACNLQSSSKQRKRKTVETSSTVSSKRPLKTIFPELPAAEQLEADHHSNKHATYSVGARIYALWDRLYYPAQVTAEPDASGRYDVVFAEDGAVRKLVATGIIPLCNLVAGRKCLTTKVNDGEEVLEEIEIIEAPSSDDAQKWMKALFKVKEIDSSDISYLTWQKLVLDGNHAKALQVATVNTVRDVTADNIASAEGRRSRAARHSASNASKISFSPTVTKTPRRNVPAEKDSTFPKTSKNIEPEQQEQQQQNSATNGSANKTSIAIFHGMTFVVTSALRKTREGEQIFSKKEIRCVIESAGGKVIDDVMKLPQGKPIYLIADTHYRTHKYLTALALGVPCVSNQWIVDSAKEKKLLDYKKYMLPAGVSLLTGDLKPWHKNNATLLSGKRVFIFSSNIFYELASFSQIWSPIIKYLGGNVIQAMPNEGLDILLTDISCTDEILNAARSQGATVVSSEWIIQAIIQGSLPEPSAHERFQYDFNDSCS
ncbi:unnamed protein product [Thelazia callipaeda]|uniref:BRCT domain-containing protein n=1 Tax=Thelazia callipaeda TaxID=103827 RepID=A0A0N5CUY3_THECL|nr:unnamed protein product [Thelazia callipaeda]